ncbi:MAG: hypothetical protein ABR549_06355 [Mycobacteriales bacterium]
MGVADGLGVRVGLGADEVGDGSTRDGATGLGAGRTVSAGREVGLGLGAGAGATGTRRMAAAGAGRTRR